MRDNAWKWLAIGLITIIVVYWGWQGWRWKQMTETRFNQVDARLNQVEAAVIKMHPELGQPPPPQPRPPQSEPQ